MYLRSFYCVVFLLSCWLNSVTYAEVYIKTAKLECSASPKYFINETCRLKPINRYKTLTFMKTFIKNILRNVSANVGLYIRNDANIYKPFLVNFTVNMCQLVDHRTSGIYAKLLLKLLTKFSNVNHACPYTGALFVQDGYLDTSLIPLANIPKYAYKVLLVFYEGYPLDYIGSVSFYMEIVESRH